jgi:hypothetical protein
MLTSAEPCLAKLATVTTSDESTRSEYEFDDAMAARSFSLRASPAANYP